MKDFVQEATLKMLLQDNISAEVEKIGEDILKKLGATQTLNQEVTTTPKKKTTKKKTSKEQTLTKVDDKSKPTQRQRKLIYERLNKQDLNREHPFVPMLMNDIATQGK
jgi:hypothetical protein